MMIDPIILSLLIRLIVPLFTLIFPFFGYVAAMLADCFGDASLVSLLGGYFGTNYHLFDKALDFYMITIAAIVSLRFIKIEKWTSINLYAIRVIGLIIFEITQLRIMLVFFPNVFEFFFVFITAAHKFKPKFKLTIKNIWIVLIILTIPKIILEILIHYLGFDKILWSSWLIIKGLLFLF